MTIRKNLLNAHLAVLIDTFNGGSLGNDIGVKAINAISSGVPSGEWRSYMSLFAVNKAQLDRLSVPAGGENSYFKKGRAYIAGNGTCGADTDTFTGKGVLDTIDENLSDVPDNLVVDPPGDGTPNQEVRPFRMPRIVP